MHVFAWRIKLAYSRALLLRWSAIMQALGDGTGEAVMQWLLHPHSWVDFQAKNLDRTPLHIDRSKRKQHNAGLFGIEDVWRLLEQGQAQYGVNVDVTAFTPAHQRQTFNTDADVDHGGSKVCITCNTMQQCIAQFQQFCIVHACGTAQKRVVQTVNTLQLRREQE